MKDWWTRVVETFVLWISVHFATRLVNTFLRHLELYDLVADVTVRLFELRNEGISVLVSFF